MSNLGFKGYDVMRGCRKFSIFSKKLLIMLLPGVIILPILYEFPLV